MFTVKFYRQEGDSDSNISVSTSRYDVYRPDGDKGTTTISVFPDRFSTGINFKLKSACSVKGGPREWDRCYIENSEGKTIAKYLGYNKKVSDHE